MINAVFALLMWQQRIFSLFFPRIAFQNSPFPVMALNKSDHNQSITVVNFLLLDGRKFSEIYLFSKRRKKYIFYKEVNFYNCLRSSWVVDGRSHTWGIADNPSYATANHVAQTKQLFLCCNCIDWKNTWSLGFLWRLKQTT